jgi:ClpP class serine protease
MSITSPLHQAWALPLEVLDQLRAIHQRHASGGAADLEAIEASLGRPLANEPLSYSVMPGGVALLTVAGVMAPKMNMLMQVSGGVSTQQLTGMLDRIAADATARSALIVWDSPGGSVLGVPAARDAMRRLAAAKPTASLVQGTMASAAYWVGSAARAVYVEGATDVLGSLGIVQRLSWDAASPTSMDLVRGRYKRLSVNGAPPSAEVIAHREAQLDYLYTLMIDDVATHRGATVEQVLAEMADGRTFIGRQAIAAGLADGEASVAELAERLAKQPETIRRRGGARSPTASPLPPAGQPDPAPARAPAQAALPALPVRAAAESPAERAERLASEAQALGLTFIEAARRDAARTAAAAKGEGELEAWFASDYAARHGITFAEACKALAIRS